MLKRVKINLENKFDAPWLIELILLNWWKYHFLLLQVPSGLPRNLEAALHRYGSSTYKAHAVTVLDQNGKPTVNLTYGKNNNLQIFWDIFIHILFRETVKLYLGHGKQNGVFQAK